MQSGEWTINSVVDGTENDGTVNFGQLRDEAGDALRKLLVAAVEEANKGKVFEFADQTITGIFEMVFPPLSDVECGHALYPA